MKALTVTHRDGVDSYVAGDGWTECVITEQGALVVRRPNDTSHTYAAGYWLTYETDVTA